MQRSLFNSLPRSGLRACSPSCRSSYRSFSRSCGLALWNGTTVPYENQKIAMPPHTGSQPAIPSIQPVSDHERVEHVHRKFVENLLSKAAASSDGLDSHVSSDSLRPASQKRRSPLKQTSLSESPHFRTDGPLTPYPIELDSGEVLEPKQATLVRIRDEHGEEHKIVVAEVEEESGKHRRVLLAVDLEEYNDSGSNGAASGRKITAEDMYATLGLEAQSTKP